MTARELQSMFWGQDSAVIETTDDEASVEHVLREIECDVSYLEDAPDELLLSYNDRFGRITERLRNLDEYLRDLNKTMV